MAVKDRERFFAEENEPVPSVGVCERVALGHLLDVLGRVELCRVSDRTRC